MLTIQQVREMGFCAKNAENGEPLHLHVRQCILHAFMCRYTACCYYYHYYIIIIDVSHIRNRIYKISLSGFPSFCTTPLSSMSCSFEGTSPMKQLSTDKTAEMGAAFEMT